MERNLNTQAHKEQNIHQSARTNLGHQPDRESSARERLLREGMRLFLLHGFTTVSTRQICVASGVTQPSLYHHFGSKEGLYIAVIERWFLDVGELLRQAIARELSLRERLHRVAVIFWSGQIGDYQAMQHDALQHLPKEHQRLLYSAIHDSLIQPILGVIRDAVESGELPSEANVYALMQLYWALVDGLAGLYNRGDSLPSPEENIAPIELFVAGARAMNRTTLDSWPAARPRAAAE